MQWFFLAVVFLCLLLLALAGAANTDPKKLARGMRMAGGFVLIAIAAILAIAGRIAFALPVGWFGLMLLGRTFGAPRGFGFPGSSKPKPGQASSVQTSHLEMVLDHDTGNIEGRFLKGRFEGRGLDELDRNDLMEALAELRGADAKGAQLLETYLDRRFEDWRQGDDSSSGEEAAQARSGPMTRDEAYEVLGLSHGASAEQIRAAHRRLMKKLHPDQGGSTVLAARVNEAKDLLLGRR